MTTSDHRLVVCDIRIKWYKLSKPKPQNTKPKFAVTKISKNKLVQIQYQSKIDELITNNINGKTTPQEKWDTIKNIIKNAALETAGLQEKPKHTNRTPDITINNLSQQQKQLRLKIQSCKTEEKISKLRKDRNKILHKISSKVQEHRSKELDEQVASIDHTNDASKMFKAAKLIHRKPYENIKIHNSEGKFVTEPNEIIKLTTEFFRNKFVDRDAQHIHPYKGKPRPLNNPITQLEIHKCFKSSTTTEQ